MPRMNAKLRELLAEGYESERDNWEPEDIDGSLAKLAAVADGDVIEHPGDFDCAELDLAPAAYVALGVDYFGLWAYTS